MYRCSQSFTTRKEQQCTPTAKTNTIPRQAVNQTGKLAQPVLVQLTLTIHEILFETRNRDNRGVRVAKHDRLTLADAILLIIGPLKHTTSMPDDLTTATTAHGLQLYTTKTRIISDHRHDIKRKKNTVAAQGMNIEILPIRRENQLLRPTYIFQKRSPSQVRPPHQMRLVNFREP